VNKQPSLGSITAHSSLDATGRFLLVANYGLGPMDEGPNQAVIAYPIREDGGLAPPTTSIAYNGKGPIAMRQERPHAHCVLSSPDNRFVVIADLGLDALLAYRFDKGRLSDEPAARSALPPGSGPRHFLFHPRGDLAIVICELDSTIASLRYHPESGSFDMIDTVSAIPAGVDHNHCSAIQLHPNGRVVYGANRGHDSIVVVGLDPDSGRLSPLDHQPCGGTTPRDMAIDPSGHFLLVANQNSDLVSVHAIDGDRGTLKLTGRDIAVGTPMCIKFASI
jgi:6-phosphogluconolactonase